MEYQYRVRRNGFHDWVIRGFTKKQDATRAMKCYLSTHPTGNMGAKSRGWVETAGTNRPKPTARKPRLWVWEVYYESPIGSRPIGFFRDKRDAMKAADAWDAKHTHIFDQANVVKWIVK